MEDDPTLGEDLRCWVIWLFKGFYGINQTPAKLHSVLMDIGFNKQTTVALSMLIAGAAMSTSG